MNMRNFKRPTDIGNTKNSLSRSRNRLQVCSISIRTSWLCKWCIWGIQSFPNPQERPKFMSYSSRYMAKTRKSTPEHRHHKTMQGYRCRTCQLPKQPESLEIATRNCHEFMTTGLGAVGENPKELVIWEPKLARKMIYQLWAYWLPE